jgi:hypothetical protein
MDLPNLGGSRRPVAPAGSAFYIYDGLHVCCTLAKDTLHGCTLWTAKTIPSKYYLSQRCQRADLYCNIDLHIYFPRCDVFSFLAGNFIHLGNFSTVDIRLEGVESGFQRKTSPGSTDHKTHLEIRFKL